MSTHQQHNSQTARNFVIVAVVGIFAILGVLIAYNSGATAEEAQNEIVMRRIGSIMKRAQACNKEISSISDGAEIKFQNRKSNLDLSLDSLKQENEMYTEQAKTVGQKLDECTSDLANERRKKTGDEGGNSSDEVLRLQYDLKRIEEVIETNNATRMDDRQKILRLVEAYARENDELHKKALELDEQHKKKQQAADDEI